MNKKIILIILNKIYISKIKYIFNILKWKGKIGHNHKACQELGNIKKTNQNWMPVSESDSDNSVEI